MSSKFDPKDIAEATEAVHRFLRFCFLSRVKSKRDGGYTLENIFLRSLIFGTVFIATDLFYLVQRIDQYTDLPTIYVVEIFSTMSCLTDFTILLYKANCNSEIKVRKEFDNLSTIDEILGVRPEMYKRDGLVVNVIFFSILVVRVILFAFCVIIFLYANGITYTLPYMPHTWAQFLQGVSYVYNICKLKLYNFRMSEINKQINRLDSVHFKRNGGDYDISSNEIKICYVKMYEVCVIFNESQGLQILLAYARLLVDSIGIIGFFNDESSRRVVWSSTAPNILLSLDVAFLVVLLYYATALLQTSKEMSFVVEKALVKNYYRIARTGSGKTAAFLWPLLVHIMDQKELAPGDGPIGLILAPTRELAQQIYMEAKKFGKVYNIRCVCCYGGGSKWEQIKALEGGGAEIIVGTPGRIIDLVKCKATNLQRVTYLVLDEADRMFDMGFEPQVRSICNHVRPERQALLYSATFPRRVERLARDALHDPVRVTHGAAGEASADVEQSVRIFSKPEQKWTWLMNKLVEFSSAGSILIFVTKKLEADQLAANLGVQEVDALLLHGDMQQSERNKVITAFKRQEVNILVATDVAARGLDIPHIRTVINYTVARDIDTHTHRVGRTGRAGVRGTAVTLLTRDKDREFAGHLVRNLEGANQDVPEELMQMAMQSSWFRKSRFKKGKGKNLNIGGCGLGYRERPGLPAKPDEEIVGIGYEKAPAGPASNRLGALKAAFKTQYNQFAASSDHSWEQTLTSNPPGVSAPLADADIDGVPLDAPPPPERVRKSGKRSRWE